MYIPFVYLSKILSVAQFSATHFSHSVFPVLALLLDQSIYYYNNHSSSSFSHYPVVFPQNSWTLLSIFTNLNNVVVWIVSTRPLISKSSNPCINPMVTVSKASITIGITITFSFSVTLQGPDTYLLFVFFQFYSVVSRNSKIYNSTSSLSFFFYFC